VKTHALIGMRPIVPLESLEPLKERIRVRAYDLYERRGRVDGHDLDDWLQAEWEESERTSVVAEYLVEASRSGKVSLAM